MELFQSNLRLRRWQINNNHIDGDTLVVGNTQVEPPVMTAPLLHPIDSVVYHHGAPRLIKAFTNMEQALHTRTPVSMDQSIFDSNPESTTAMQAP